MLLSRVHAKASMQSSLPITFQRFNWSRSCRYARSSSPFRGSTVCVHTPRRSLQSYSAIPAQPSPACPWTPPPYPKAYYHWRTVCLRVRTGSPPFLWLNRWACLPRPAACWFNAIVRWCDAWARQSWTGWAHCFDVRSRSVIKGMYWCRCCVFLTREGLLFGYRITALWWCITALSCLWSMIIIHFLILIS